MLKTIDRHRKVFNTDYVDSLLIHCMVKDHWTDPWKRIMDGFEEAKARKWIRVQGRFLPQPAGAANRGGLGLARRAPGAGQPAGQPHRRAGGEWNKSGKDVAPVVEQLQAMHAKGRGVIGMKLVATATFRIPPTGKKPRGS